MYKQAYKSLWTGRIDTEDGELGKRWHEKIEFIEYPYQAKADIAFLGFACDEGVRRNKGRVGAANGPNALKSSLAKFAWHLKNTKIYDCGNVLCEQNLELTQAELSKHISQLIKNKHFPIILGGGHEVAFASFVGLDDALTNSKDIAVINFDAHFDLRESKTPNSGTGFSQIAKRCQKNGTKFSYFCLGIAQSANSKALFAKAAELNVGYILDKQMSNKNLEQIKARLSKFLKNKEHIYISFDADVLPAYLMPAVSAPAARGVKLEIIEDLLEFLFQNYRKNIKLIDFAEFNPKYDAKSLGQTVLARLIYDLSIFIAHDLA